jgi:hypothetical protein
MRTPALISSAAALFLSAACLLSSAPVRADEPLGADEVTLKNGGMVRGSVVTVEPGTKVVLIEAGSTTPRTIPWAEVADVERGKYAGKGEAKEKGDSAKEDAKAEPETDGKAGVVKLHIDSGERVQLHEELDTRYASAGGYAIAVSTEHVACTSPCDRVIDGSRGQRFVVAGDGVPPSDPFYLNDRSGETTVKVDPGSTGRKALGGTLTGLGILGGLTGGTLVLVGALVEDRSTKGDLMVSGGVTLGASAAAIAGGIILLATSSTSVEIGPKPERTGGSSGKTARKARIWMGEF